MWIQITIFLIALHINNAELLSNTIIPDGIFLNSSHQSIYDDTFDIYVPRAETSGHDAFSWKLLNSILKNNNNDNVIISPFSVKFTLALLLEASDTKSTTQKELLSTQQLFVNTTESLRLYYKNILSSIQKNNKSSVLNLNTKIFTDEFIEPQQRYGGILLENYNTEIQSLDFNNTKAAAMVINDWCYNASHGQIKQIVNDDAIKNNVMILANVIYYKGQWQREFNETFEGAFFKSTYNQIKVSYMEQIGHFYYYNSKVLHCKILRLPYKDTLSMFVVLPETDHDINDIVSILNASSISQLQWMLEDTKVKINLPKFKFNFNQNLKESLIHLGVTEIFTNAASLPGLARGGEVAGKVMVTNILQTAGIDVNERGTEASAATVVEIGNKFGGSEVIEEFIVNRPFIFFIEDESTGNILFAGKTTDPTYFT